MPNNIEIANINYRSLIDPASRYNKSSIIYYGDKKFITFETYKRDSYSVSANDKFYVITKITEYRPDLVSKKAYGTVSYWWKLLEANGMMDIMQFKAGTNIVIPGSI
jgi:hypothetical protein